MKSIITLLKKIGSKIKSRMKQLDMKKRIEYFNARYFVCVLIEAIALDYLIEVFSRHSLFEPFVYLVRNPVIYVYNILILFGLLSVGAVFRRRLLYAGVITIACLALGITNGILLGFRTTPFAAVDFTLIGNVMTIIDLYLSWFSIIMILAALVLIIVICIIIGMKSPKYEGKMHRIPTVLIVAVFMLSLVGLDNVIIGMGIAPKNYSNLGDAYKNYGFVYCFTNSFMKLGMEKPDNYSPETVDAILEETLEKDGDSELDDQAEAGVKVPADQTEEEKGGDISEESAGTAMDTSNPNIIFVQLESFFDVSNVIGLETSIDPLPNFHLFSANHASGALYVPSVGAGTANTEFEVITGLDMDYFGPGEYPYKTVLKQTTCESAAYDLKKLGYVTHAIHDNDGTFYDRNLVYPNLGFDTFTSIEYMYNVERNANGFCKDRILTREILNTLMSTEERDYIFAVSVQAHGDYPSERRGDDQPVFIRYTDEEKENAWSYYVNQLYEMDQFIGQLYYTLKSYKEPVILVLYGDHIPGLGLETDDVSNGRLTETQYVILSNFELSTKDENLEAYQLMSKVLGLAGIHEGVINSFHQKHMEDIDYLDKLEVLQYDMLYGDREAFAGENPYLPTNMSMGISEIKINSITTEEDGSIYVRGANFNEYSVLYCNGSVVSAVLIDRNTMQIMNHHEVVPGNRYQIGQVGTDKFCLGYSEAYIAE